MAGGVRVSNGSRTYNGVRNGRGSRFAFGVRMADGSRLFNGVRAPTRLAPLVWGPELQRLAFQHRGSFAERLTLESRGPGGSRLCPLSGARAAYRIAEMPKFVAFATTTTVTASTTALTN